MNNFSLPFAVVCGAADANGYGIIRSLARSGVLVIALDTSRRALGIYSRYCKGIVCPDPKKTSEKIFIDFLIKLVSGANKKAVLFPYREDLQLIVLKNWDKLEDHYILPMSGLEKAEIIMDKAKFSKALEAMDIPYPKTYYPGDNQTIDKISNEIEYPCIIKPIKSMEFGRKFGLKVFKADSKKQLIEAYQLTVDSGYQVIVQEVVPGEDNQLFTFFGYFDRNSKLLGAFTMVKLRQYPPGFGVTALGKSVWQPEIIDLGTKFLQKIGYHGIVDAEFKKDFRDDSFKIIEINARTGIQNRLATRCGVNLPYIAYMDSIGQQVGEFNYNGKEIKWISEINDLRTSLKSIFKRELTAKAWFRSLRGEKEYSIFAWDDPVPFMVLLVNTIPDIFRAFIIRPILLLKAKRKNAAN